MSNHRFDHHPTCPCGCGELADECAGPVRNPLGSITVEPVGRWSPKIEREARILRGFFS